VLANNNTCFTIYVYGVYCDLDTILLLLKQFVHRLYSFLTTVTWCTKKRKG